MSEYNSNYEIAQAISERIGTAPIPFDSVYEICLTIYNELGGEPAQFDSVYEILLGILPLAEGGSSRLIDDETISTEKTWSSSKISSELEQVDVDPITNVNELPNAGENKNKFYRLSSDDNVYVSELKSRTSTTTNRLPDAQQIDKAYLIDANPMVYKYEGDWTIVCSDGNVILKCWNYDIEDDSAFFTLDNAENISTSSKIISVPLLDWTDVDLENKSLNVDNSKSEVLELIENGNTLPTYELIPVPATYNAPESAQIGNAYYGSGAITTYYTGEEVTITYDGETKTGYKWVNPNNNTYFVATDKKASELLFYLYNEQPYGNKIYGDFHIYQYTPGDGWEDFTDELVGGFYILQLNAPDSEQVGNATISEDSIGSTCVYTGEEETIEVDGDNVTAYKWVDNGSPNTPLYTTKPAYQIYNTNRDSDNVHIYIDEYGTIYEITFAEGYLLSISTVKYQRTETIEEWSWQSLTDNATDADIDAMFDAPTPTEE